MCGSCNFLERMPHELDRQPQAASQASIADVVAGIKTSGRTIHVNPSAMFEAVPVVSSVTVPVTRPFEEPDHPPEVVVPKNSKSKSSRKVQPANQSTNSKSTLCYLRECVGGGCRSVVEVRT